MSSRDTRRTPAPPRPTPARQLGGFVARFDPAIARLVRGARRLLRARFPTAIELVYDNYNALAIGWAGTERASDVIVSIAVYATGVSLYFTYGKSLPDPTHRLEGAGNQGRFVRLPDLAVLREPAVEALLAAAETQARAPLPARGRGRTVVKSVSARQRPRRRSPTAARAAATAPRKASLTTSGKPPRKTSGKAPADKARQRPTAT